MPRLQIYRARVYCLGKCSPPAGCEGRSATRSSHSFCLTGELLSPARSDVPKKMHRVQNLESPIRGRSHLCSGIPSPDGIRKQKVRSIQNSLHTLAGNKIFGLLTSAWRADPWDSTFNQQCSVSDRAFSRLKDFAWAIGCKSIGKFKREV